MRHNQTFLKRSLKVLLPGLAVIGLLSACGQQSGTAQPAAGTQAEAAETAGTAEGQAVADENAASGDVNADGAAGSKEAADAAGADAGGNGPDDKADADSTGAAGAFAADISEVVTNLSTLDSSKWQYDAERDFYWQTGISYCETPADESYETMGFYVPGAYFTAEDNGDGTYTCTVNPEGTVAGYTAETAPIGIPVNTPGYAAMSAPADNESSCGYGSIENYTDAGFVLAFAGARGRDHGAPGGVTDFKAAIRYTRYNLLAEDGALLPGNADRIFSFGMSGGGAQSALIGATGDSELYTPYLDAIGAVQGVSDAVLGSMCWCPITNLDVADAAYEWNMGSARTDLDEETKALSDGLSAAFAEYIEAVGLKDEDGQMLLISDGSYEAYIKDVIETSLEHFLVDTEFPYDASSANAGGPGGRGGHGGFPGGQGGFPGGKNGQGGQGGFQGDQAGQGGQSDKNGQEGQGAQGNQVGFPDGSQERADGGDAADGADGTQDYAAIDNIARVAATGGLSLTGTYETAEDYIDALNQEKEWVQYDAAAGEIEITGIADFVEAMKQPSKSVGAFDDLNRTQGENTLFGYGDGAGAHFDAIEAALLQGTEYEAAFDEDLSREDALGNTVDYRVNMYNPMFYLCDYYEGYQTANVAPYFRIRTGISQGDTALCTEADLALALAAYGSDVDFETIWAKGHTEAERTGDSTENFITWVRKCLE